MPRNVALTSFASYETTRQVKFPRHWKRSEGMLVVPVPGYGVSTSATVWKLWSKDCHPVTYICRGGCCPAGRAGCLLELNGTASETKNETKRQPIFFCCRSLLFSISCSVAILVVVLALLLLVFAEL